MANPHKGEVSFTADGKEHKLRFSADAICNLEDALDMGVNQIGDAMRDPKTLRMKFVRAAFVAGLRDTDPDMTDDQARGVFKRLGMVEAIDLVSRAFTAAFADDGDAKGEGAANPPQPGPPPTGTGPASGETG